MRRLSKFTLVTAATLSVSMAAAVAALLGFERVALALLAGAVLLVAGMIFLADRRTQAAIRRGGGMEGLVREVQRTSAQVDMMQRRVVGALETARLEAADRSRDRASGDGR